MLDISSIIEHVYYYLIIGVFCYVGEKGQSYQSRSVFGIYNGMIKY